MNERGLFAIGGALLAIACGAYVAFNLMFPLVTFVVPNGYRGRLEIIEDGQGGIVVRPGKLAFPGTGQIRVKSLKFFQRAHTLHCRQEDGVVIPRGFDVDDATVALRTGSLSSMNGQEIYSFVIGTEQDVSVISEMIEREFEVPHQQ